MIDLSIDPAFYFKIFLKKKIVKGKIIVNTPNTPLTAYLSLNYSKQKIYNFI